MTNGYHHDANPACNCPMSMREIMERDGNDGPGPWHSRGCPQWRPLSAAPEPPKEAA
jgi:hypothetical protein